MSEEEIKRWFSNEIKEIKDSIKELGNLITNLRLELAEDYVRKSEYDKKIIDIYSKIDILGNKVITTKEEVDKKIEDHKKEERNYNYKVLGIGFAAFSAVFGMIQWVYKLASGN